MLQTIRERAQGWIAWVIVILLIIPFALWGIQSYLGVSGEPVAAKVNGFELTERNLDQQIRQARIELREQLGAAYDPALFEGAALREQVLDDMIREALLLDAARRLGLRVSDEELRLQILSEPAFQSNGRFDRETYEQMLRLQGLSPASFEAGLRQQMVGTQLPRALVESAFLTSADIADYQRLSGQQRAIDFARFAASDFLESDAPVEEAEIQRYFEAHSSDFRTPEQVRLDYLVLDATALASDVAVDEEEMRAAYERDRARFVEPERREVRHLLLSLPPDADEAKVAATRAEIEALRERIAAGESFEELAREHSKDPGSAERGGSLGKVNRDTLEPSFAQVAFSLQPGELSEPVRTPFGFHLIKVDSIESEEIRAFEAVRDQLHEELARQQAEAMYYELGERLASLAYEMPDSLDPVAEELGLEVAHSDWLSREGGEGLLGNPKVVAAAFSPEVLENGNNSDLIEPERDVLRAILVRVTEHRPAATRSLDEVREDILAAIRTERARAAARAAADTALEQLRAGGAWESLPEQAKVSALGLVDRYAAEAPVPVRELAFTMPAPAEDAASYGVVELEEGDAAVVRLTEVRDGEVKVAEGASTPESLLLAQLLGRHLYEAMLDDMALRASIERKAPQEEEAP